MNRVSQSSVLALQLEEDVRDECAVYGTVEGVCIPVPPRTMPPSEPGRAYIMFGSHEEATKAKPVFDGRLFDDGKVTAKLVPDDDFQRAAAGEWIHTPMPGGLPAHPGNASNGSLLSFASVDLQAQHQDHLGCCIHEVCCTLDWPYLVCHWIVKAEGSMYQREQGLYNLCQLQSGSMGTSCKSNIACKKMVSALHLDFVSLLALTRIV